MSERTELDLLNDIVKLLTKYGPDTFEQLSQLVSSADFSERLAAVLSKSAEVSRRAGRARPDGPTSSLSNLRSSLLTLSSSDPERSKVLVGIFDRMAAKSLLPSLRDVRDFAIDNGLPPIKATSRDKAIAPFIKSLQPLEIGELKKVAEKLRPISSKGDRSLEGWSDVILGGRSRPDTPHDTE